jgi:hypothetical protein
MAESWEREVRAGDRKSKSDDATLKLSGLGVTRTESSRWHKTGALDEEAFDSRVTIAKKRSLIRRRYGR